MNELPKVNVKLEFKFEVAYDHVSPRASWDARRAHSRKPVSSFSGATVGSSASKGNIQHDILVVYSSEVKRYSVSLV